MEILFKFSIRLQFGHWSVLDDHEMYPFRVLEKNKRVDVVWPLAYVKKEGWLRFLTLSL